MKVVDAADFDTFRAMWSLGILPTSALPIAGVRALEAGIDIEAARILAGRNESSVDEKDVELFKTVLEQFALLSLDEAAIICSRTIASNILTGKIDPYAGAQAIWFAAEKVNSDHEFHVLDGFIYAASEYEERPGDRAFFVRAIEEEARNLVVRLAK
jgi:hypothetical protein